jgi:hypothetical protein
MAIVCWAVLGLIHLLPAVALFRPAMLTQLYGAAPGGEVFVLLHHRAALFLAVLVVCVWAALDPAVRRLASVAVAVSMLGFLVLWVRAGSPPALRTIALADLAGLPFLAVAAWLAWRP